MALFREVLARRKQALELALTMILKVLWEIVVGSEELRRFTKLLTLQIKAFLVRN